MFYTIQSELATFQVLTWPRVADSYSSRQHRSVQVEYAFPGILEIRRASN